MTKVQEARRLAKQYGATLPKAWKGYALVWHPWHAPANRLLWPMTYAQFVDRVIEIALDKPENERRERLSLMKLFRGVKADAALVKADAARDKAKAVWVKADAAWRSKKHDKIMAAHALECPGCKWDGDRLPQFD